MPSHFPAAIATPVTARMAPTQSQNLRLLTPLSFGSRRGTRTSFVLVQRRDRSLYRRIRRVERILPVAPEVWPVVDVWPELDLGAVFQRFFDGGGVVAATGRAVDSAGAPPGHHVVDRPAIGSTPETEATRRRFGDRHQLVPHPNGPVCQPPIGPAAGEKPGGDKAEQAGGSGSVG